MKIKGRRKAVAVSTERCGGRIMRVGEKRPVGGRKREGENARKVYTNTGKEGECDGAW